MISFFFIISLLPFNVKIYTPAFNPDVLTSNWLPFQRNICKLFLLWSLLL